MAAPAVDTSLETLIAHLKAADVVTSHDVDPKILAAGLEDLKNRMGYVEFSHLKALSQTRANSDRMTAVEADVATLKTDRDEFRKQVRTAVDTPTENATKITELEARVHAVEGAVGAAPYKGPKPVEPAKPKVEPDKPKIEPTPAPSINPFSPPSAPPQ
jgi:chromosome segregation ATPase